MAFLPYQRNPENPHISRGYRVRRTEKERHLIGICTNIRLAITPEVDAKFS